MCALLDECEQVARAANNNALLPLVSKAKEFFRSLEFAIWFRFKMFGISA